MTAVESIDLQVAAKEHLGFGGAQVVGVHSGSSMPSDTRPSSAA